MRYTDGLVPIAGLESAIETLSAAKAPKKDGKGNPYVDMTSRHMPLLDAMRTASRKAFIAAFRGKKYNSYIAGKAPELSENK